MGVPLVHISFKYRFGRRPASWTPWVPVPARGIISIGQFGMGVINISQFGVGIVSVSQFTVAGYALAQFAIADSLIAQIGFYFSRGYGQFVWNIFELIEKLF
jgi:hypothetical protein